MMRILFTLLLIACLQPCYAQPGKRPVTTDPAVLVVPEPDATGNNTAWKEEIAELDQVLKDKTLKKAERVNALLKRGYAKIRQEHKAGAIADYEAALQLDSTEENAYHNLGLIYARHEDCKTATQVAERGLKKCKKKENLYLLLANCKNMEHQRQESLAYYDKALELNPDFGLAYYNRGYAWFELKKYPEALADFYKAIQIRETTGDEDVDLADTYFYMGTAYQNQGINDSALVFLDLALEQQDYWTYYSNKGTLLNDELRYQEALATLNKGISLYPDTADLYYARSNTYLGLQDIDKQVKDLDKILSLDPDHVSALINKAVYWERQNKMTDALRNYHKAIGLAPDRYEPYANIANIYKDEELKRDSADYYYRMALNLAPDKAAIYFNYGNYFMKMDRRDAAINQYKQSLKLDPSLTKAYNNLATLYFKKKQDSIARYYLEEGLAINPADEMLNNNMLVYYFDRKEYDSAITYATRVIQVNKHDIEAIFKRGLSRQNLAMYRDALYDYQDCLSQLAPEGQRQNSTIYANIGYCYMELNELEPALKYFKTAVTYNAETDQLIGLFTVNYLLKKEQDFSFYFNKALAGAPVLHKGMKGIEQLERQGYFYTPQHKAVLKTIFATKGIK